MYSAASDNRLDEHLTPNTTLTRSHDMVELTSQAEDTTLTRNNNKRREPVTRLRDDTQQDAIYSQRSIHEV